MFAMGLERGFLLSGLTKWNTLVGTVFAIILAVAGTWSAALGEPASDTMKTCMPREKAPAVGGSGTANPVPQPVSGSADSRVRCGFALSADVFGTLVDQSTRGPGTTPPEGPGFSNGSPLSPNTPYDTFSSAAQVPGVLAHAQAVVTATYGAHAFAASLRFGGGYVRGSTTNAAYWSEPLLPTLNPHLGSRALPYTVAFPTHAGQDDGTASRLSILSGELATADRQFRIRAGWFDLVQSDSFVFTQPPSTNASLALAPQTAETVGNGSPAIDWWNAGPTSLPLHGVDLIATRGSAVFEATSAALPSLGGTGARLNMVSGVLDRGNGTRFSAQLAHVSTSGDSIATTTFYGENAVANLSPQGRLPVSSLGAQRQTVAGVRAAFHATRTLDGLVEIGRAYYTANGVAHPGTEAPSGYYHIGVQRQIGRVTAGIDGYRFESRYATVILPYGSPENIWSSGWSWPGAWLKSTYQIVDNTKLGVNRQGFGLHYNVDGGPLEVHASYTNVQQIEAATISNVSRVGFVEGFFLPQVGSSGTLGRIQRFAVWSAWHPAIADISLDLVSDEMHRPAPKNHPEDGVSEDVPQYVLTLSRAFGTRTKIAMGIGRFGTLAGWAVDGAPNVSFGQREAFVGAQIQQSPKTATEILIRRTTFAGFHPTPVQSSVDYVGTLFLIEQRIKL